MPAVRRALAGELPRPVGYVLGGGAAYGAVQVGMLEALAETDLAPDLVVGTSVGALNGALVAEDPVAAPHRLAHLWARLRGDDIFPGGVVARYRTLRTARGWLYDAEPLARVLLGTLRAQSFEQLALPFAACATDLLTGALVVQREGPLQPALLASAAIPGVFPWVQRDGRRLVDGFVVANVPVAQAVELGARSVVVLDCGVFGVSPQVRGTLVDVIVQTVIIMLRQQVVRDLAVAKDVPVVYLPGAGPITSLAVDFGHTVELSAAAYEASRAFLAGLTVAGPGIYGGPPLVRDHPDLVGYLR